MSHQANEEICGVDKGRYRLFFVYRQMTFCYCRNNKTVKTVGKCSEELKIWKKESRSTGVKCT